MDSKQDLTKLQADDAQVEQTILRLNKQIQANGKYTRNAKAAIREWLSELNKGNVASARLSQINAEAKELHTNMAAINRSGQSFFEKIGSKISSLGINIGPAAIFSKTISWAGNGLASVRKLDTALVDLKMTASMTKKEQEAIYYASNDVAKQMGVTTEEIINQTAAWSQLGFSNAEAAAKMARYSSMLAGISPGMGVNDAQEGLSGIMKAWGLDADEVEREVLDNINALSNRFATSNLDLINGMKTSAAALADAGTGYREAFALFTGAQETVQNAEAAGRALRSISMRMQGYSEESDDGLKTVDEELKNITGDLTDLTKTAEHSQGISILKEGSSTEFKSFVQYFGEIHDIWDEMSQVQQNAFLEKAFGRNQAQAGAAIIQNYETIAEAMKAMETAGGSAEKEMSVIMDSLDYKLNTAAETATGIAQNLFKKEDMTSVVDVFNSFMGIIDRITEKLGLFKTIGLGAGIFAGVRNIGKTYERTDFESYVYLF